MNREKIVFSQLAAFLDNNKFRRLVDKYQGDHYVKNFTCWNQLLVLMFGRLCGRENLHDLIVTLEANKSKCYHLGFGHDRHRNFLALIKTGKPPALPGVYQF